jgi:hypothetical protein
MSADLVQTAAAGSIVLGAALYVGRRWWKTVSAARAPKDGPGCGAGCGCGDEH